MLHVSLSQMQVGLAVHEQLGQALNDGCADQSHPLILVNWPVADNEATYVKQSQDAAISAKAARNATSQNALGDWCNLVHFGWCNYIHDPYT